MAETTPSAALQQTTDLTLRPHIPEWRRLWTRFIRNRSARIGSIIVVAYIVIALIVPALDHSYDPFKNNLRARFEAPVIRAAGSEETTYVFGTDDQGRDVLRRVGHGASISLTVSILAVSVSLIIGTIVGEVAGFLGGWTDSVLMRLMDIMLAFPSLLLAISLIAILGKGLRSAMLAIGIVSIPVYARLARSMAIGLRNEDFVMASRSVGASQFYVLKNHIFPNSLAPIIVQATLGMGIAVVETAALGFLGLGQQAPYPELGKMLADSQEFLVYGKWWSMVFPGLAITLVVLGFNLLGDGLRDTLDPKLRGRS